MGLFGTCVGLFGTYIRSVIHVGFRNPEYLHLALCIT